MVRREATAEDIDSVLIILPQRSRGLIADSGEKTVKKRSKVPVFIIFGWNSASSGTL
jgi:hypothetical protein